MWRTCISQLLICGNNPIYCSHVRHVRLDPSYRRNFLALRTSQGTLGSTCQERIWINGSSFAQRLVYLGHAFLLSKSGVPVSYEDGKPPVEYDFLFSFQRWVEEFGVLYLSYDLMILGFLCTLKLHLLEWTMIWIFGCCAKLPHAWWGFSEERTTCSLQS